MTSERDDEVSLSQAAPSGIIYNLKKAFNYAPAGDQAEYDTPDTIRAIQSAIESHGFKTKLFEADRDLPQKLVNSGCALMFNICGRDQWRGRVSAGSRTPEYDGDTFTGSDETT
jgi:hypothetical protein